MKRKKFDGPSLHVKMTKGMRESIRLMATKADLDDSEFIREIIRRVIAEEFIRNNSEKTKGLNHDEISCNG